MEILNLIVVVVIALGAGTLAIVLRKRNELSRMLGFSLILSLSSTLLWILCIWALFTRNLNQPTAELMSASVFLSVSIAGYSSYLLVVEFTASRIEYKSAGFLFYSLLCLFVLVLILTGNVSRGVTGSAFNYKPIYGWGQIPFALAALALIPLLVRVFLRGYQSAESTRNEVLRFQISFFAPLLLASVVGSVIFNAFFPALGLRDFILLGPSAMVFAFFGLSILILKGELVYLWAVLSRQIKRFGSDMPVEPVSELLEAIGNCSSGGTSLRSLRRVSFPSSEGSVAAYLIRGFDLLPAEGKEEIPDDMEGLVWQQIEDQGRLNGQLLARSERLEQQLGGLVSALRRLLPEPFLQKIQTEMFVHADGDGLALKSPAGIPVSISGDDQRLKISFYSIDAEGNMIGGLDPLVLSILKKQARLSVEWQEFSFSIPGRASQDPSAEENFMMANLLQPVAIHDEVIQIRIGLFEDTPLLKAGRYLVEVETI